MNRLGRLQEAMRDEGIGLAIVGPTSSLEYLLGYKSFALDRLTALLVSPVSAVMVMPEFDAEDFMELTGLGTVRSWVDQPGYVDAVTSALDDLDVNESSSVAVDDELSFGFFRQLEPFIDGLPRIGLNALLMPLRMIKGPDEQAKMAAAGELVSLGLERALSVARPGRSEREVAHDIESALRVEGASSVDLVVVAAGVSSAAPHHRPSNRLLEHGEPVGICIVAGVDGYLADISQHLHIGQPSPEFQRAYDAVWQAEQLALEAARPGTTAEDIDRLALEVIQDAGFGQWFGSRTGHGIGIDIVEPPSIWPEDTTILVAGIALIVGPGIRIPGRYGLRIDDTVVVTAAAPHVLTNASRPLAVV